MIMIPRLRNLIVLSDAHVAPVTSEILIAIPSQKGNSSEMLVILIGEVQRSPIRIKKLKPDVKATLFKFENIERE
jgi:hypothetical protein